MNDDHTRNTEIDPTDVEELDEVEETEAEAEAEVEEHAAPLGDLDDAPLDEVAPEAAVAESLRNALTQMRSEADRIAALDTGDEQVQAAERFAEAAGSLDEQVGSSARADDDARA